MIYFFIFYFDYLIFYYLYQMLDLTLISFLKFLPLM